MRETLRFIRLDRDLQPLLCGLGFGSFKAKPHELFMNFRH